jgi:hypothetical protein
MLAAAMIMTAALGGSQPADYPEVRAVHDAARVPFDAIVDSPSPPWIVMQVTPAANSGSVVAEGAYINIDTGKLVTEPGARFPIVESGKWKLVAALSPMAETSGEYRWEVSEPFTRRVEIDGLYSPFARGGLVLCRYRAERQDSGRFSPVYVLPSDWEPFVKPALEEYRSKRGSFRLEEEGQQADLERLLKHENPLLAVVALRTLVERGRISGPALQDVLVQSRDLRQASLVYAALTGASEHDASTVDQAVAGAIGAAQRAVGLKGLALGVLASTFAPAPAPEALRTRCDALFRTLSRKQAAFGSATEADRYVFGILQMVGLTSRSPQKAPESGGVSHDN